MSPVRKRSGFFSRKKLRRMLSGIALLSILTVSASVLLMAWGGYHSIYLQPWVYAPPPPPIFRAARKIYPFSIIPGGVYEPKELTQSIQLDPSLAEHYRDIRMESLVAVRTQASMLAYVSFRNGGQIFWSSKELTIPRGELVLTDGKHMVRSRCGNRIQRERPRSAVSSSVITEQMQNLIMDAPLPSISKLPPYLQPVLVPGALVSDVWKDPGSEIPAVPEPGTLILFASGFLLISLMTFHRG